MFALTVAADGRRVLSGSGDNTIRVWDLNSGAMFAILAGHEAPVPAVAITPDQQRIVSASFDQTVRVWDLSRATATATLAGHFDAARAVQVTPDGWRAIVGFYDGPYASGISSGAPRSGLWSATRVRSAP